MIEHSGEIILELKTEASCAAQTPLLIEEGTAYTTSSAGNDFVNVNLCPTVFIFF